MPHGLDGFTVVAATMLLASVAGALAVGLRQPLIVAFIAVGALAGPSGLGWVQREGAVELLAEIGLAVLLFLVGLKLDVGVIRSMGPVALAAGLGQVAFTWSLGFAICLGFGLGAAPSAYVALALTFSSTIIVVKLLSDKREIDSLHGRISVGVLIVQDLVVILAMIVLSAIGPASRGGDDIGALELWRGAVIIAGKGLALLAVVGVLMKFVIPSVVHVAARSQELLLLFAISWAVGLASASDLIGFSKEVGAFLAGVSLASTVYRDAIGGRLTALRDFLLLFFFLGLGASLELDRLGSQVPGAAALSLFVIVGKPLVVMAIMGAMGYRRRTGFITGITLAQISEFSLILCALGVSLGHIGEEAMGMITLVGLITIGLSTYLILYSHPLYQRLSPWLGVFERRVPHREAGTGEGHDERFDVIVFGLGRYGERIALGLGERGRRVLGVDFDPRVVRRWKSEGRPAQYGDAEDPEFPASLPLEGVSWVVGTMPERDVNSALLSHLRGRGYRGKIALTAHHARDDSSLREAGADEVLMPFADAATEAVDRLTGGGAPDESPGPG